MFVRTPRELGSLKKEQIYGCNSEFLMDHHLEIREANSGAIIGVKKFYSASDFELNISPLAYEFAIPTPQSHITRFSTDSRQGVVSLVVTDIDTAESSEERTFTLAGGGADGVGVITSLPTERAIIAGESDTIMMRVEGGSEVMAIVNRFKYDWEAERYGEECAEGESDIYTVDAPEHGILSFTLHLDEGESEELDRVVVLFVQGAEQIATINYTVVDCPKCPRRVAWVSRCGSLEHYTMPFVTSELRGGDGSTTLTLRSAKEEYTVRRALAEIVEAPRAWIVGDDGEYLDVEVVSKGVETSPAAILESVEFKVCYHD